MSHVGGRTNLRSPEEQTEEIERWAVAHGHRVEFLPPELDRKGSDPSREIFRQAIDGVKAGRYSGLVVAYLSRAGRDLRLMLDLWDEVEGAGGVFYSARENIDASTSNGKLQRNIRASIDQHELEERRDGFERATKAAVEAGIWQRRQTPRGYNRDTTTRRLVVNEQVEDVRWAARELLGGRPVIRIAEALGMTPGGVRAMLRNRVYLGELKVRSYVNKEAHTAILDPEIFEAVQAHLRSAPRPGRNSSKQRAPLAGLVRCRSCGHVMTRGTGKQGYVYKCPTYHSGERCPRPAAIIAAPLDLYVAKIGRLELRRLRVTAREGDGLAAARREVAAAKTEFSTFLEAVEAAGIGAADAAAGMRRRRESVEAAEEKERAEMARIPRLPMIERADEIWDDLTDAERNELLRSLLSAVIVRPVGAGRKVPVAERTRVLRHGAEIVLPAGRTGAASGIVPLGWPDADGVDVLGIPAGEDLLEGPGRIGEV